VLRNCGAKKTTPGDCQARGAAKRIELLHQIDRNHTGWCESDGWRDGGARERSGYRGVTGDCDCRAIATALPYQRVYDDLSALGAQEREYRQRSRKSHRRARIWPSAVRRYLTSLGWRWMPTMHIGSRCTVHLRRGESPETGRLMLSVSRHVVAVIDGRTHDVHDPSRGGARSVYGFWTQPNKLLSNFQKGENQMNAIHY
jgi:hypothetical protein